MLKAERLDRPSRIAIAATTLLTLLLWVFYSRHWSALLDSDAALYSLMSLETLKGHHYLFTAGQSHGGTPLVYLRAAMFAVTGASQFLGFYINGVCAALGVALWARAAGRLAGPTAALVTGLAGACGSEIFIQYSLTDYFALSLVSGGLMLNAAVELAPRPSIPARAFFFLGLLLGVSLYVCRFTALYAVAAFAFFLFLSSSVRRAALLPTKRELLKSRGLTGKLSKVLLAAIVINLALFPPAFFTSDRFLGVNAEVTLKLIVKLAAALWLLHRWRLLATAPGRAGWLVAGVALGLAPHFMFAHLHPEAIDRTTGLVRWSDFASLLPQAPETLGSVFSRSSPLDFGLASASAAVLLLAAGFLGGDRRRRSLLAIALVAAVMPALASWILIHTYMYFKLQYFYPVYLPLFLALGLATAATRFKKTAFALLVPVLAGGLCDARWIVTRPNDFLSSGVLEQMKAWRVDVGTGLYDSTYDLMWTYGARITLEPIGNGRFPRFQALLDAAPRFAFVARPGDSMPESLSHGPFKLLAHAELNHGFSADLFSRADRK